MTPLIEIPPIPWDFETDQPSKTIDNHLARTGDTIATSWGSGQRFFVDLFTLADEGPLADGRHALTFVFDELRVRGLQAVPVTGLSRDSDYQDAVRAEPLQTTAAESAFG